MNIMMKMDPFVNIHAIPRMPSAQKALSLDVSVTRVMCEISGCVSGRLRAPPRNDAENQFMLIGIASERNVIRYYIQMLI